jgi:hypothetical protein
MRRIIAELGSALSIAVGFGCTTIPAAAQNGNLADSIPYFRVDSPVSGSTLTSGQRVPISFRLKYNLTSADQALLHVYVEEFPESAQGFSGSVQMANGGLDIPIKRGSKELIETLYWLGDQPVYPRGHLTLGVMLFTPDGRQMIKSFGLFTAYWWSFSGSSGPSISGSPWRQSVPNAPPTPQNGKIIGGSPWRHGVPNAPTSPQNSNPGDSIRFATVSWPVPSALNSDGSLATGQPEDFKIRLSYNLNSVDSAFLVIYVEEFPASDRGLSGSVHSTDGATYIPIQRGSHDITVTVA